MISSIILAAGESSRMGKAKLALRYQGKPLLEHAILKAKSLSQDVIVVVGAYPELYTPIAEKQGARVFLNLAWREGLGSSLKVGAKQLSASSEQAFVLLADQPFVPEAHLEALLRTQERSSADLVFSSYDGVQGPPVLMQETLFEAAKNLKGNCGAKALIQKDTLVAAVILEQYFDIDTPEEAEKLLGLKVTERH